MWKGDIRWIEFFNDGAFRFIKPGFNFENVEYDGEINISGSNKLLFLPPFNSSKVIGLAYNYKSLVGPQDKYDEPLFFLKSPTSLCGHQSIIQFPPFADIVWVEVELVVIIKQQCRNISPSQAKDYILGYSIGSDITAKNISNRDHHLARSKALDNFGPVGPYLVTDLETNNIGLQTFIDGKEFQNGNTNDRILNDFESVSLISKYITLEAGDAIFTGSPAGAMSSIVKPGSKVKHHIDNIGDLEFTIE